MNRAVAAAGDNGSPVLQVVDLLAEVQPERCTVTAFELMSRDPCFANPAGVSGTEQQSGWRPTFVGVSAGRRCCLRCLYFSGVPLRPTTDGSRNRRSCGAPRPHNVSVFDGTYTAGGESAVCFKRNGARLHVTFVRASNDVTLWRDGPRSCTADQILKRCAMARTVRRRYTKARVLAGASLAETVS